VKIPQKIAKGRFFCETDVARRALMWFQKGLRLYHYERYCILIDTPGHFSKRAKEREIYEIIKIIKMIVLHN